MSDSKEPMAGGPQTPGELLEAEVRKGISHRKALSWIASALAVMERQFQGAAFGDRDRLFKAPLDVWVDMANILRVLHEKLVEIHSWRSTDEGDA